MGTELPSGQCPRDVRTCARPTVRTGAAKLTFGSPTVLVNGGLLATMRPHAPGLLLSFGCAAAAAAGCPLQLSA